MTTPMTRLRAHLLRLGGKEAHVPDAEPDAEKIISRGRVWGGEAATAQPGLPNRCHQNAITTAVLQPSRESAEQTAELILQALAPQPRWRRRQSTTRARAPDRD